MVSARGWSIEARTLTKEWLHKHDLPYDELIITEVGANKMKSLQHHKKIELVVDDNMENCIHFSSSEKVSTTIMMSAPWNLKE